jgi:hypothetical protein
MGLSDLVNRAKDLVQKRGGSEALKADADELKDIAKSDASMSEKAKQSADALKDPGAKDTGATDPGAKDAGPNEPGAKGPGQ